LESYEAYKYAIPQNSGSLKVTASGESPYISSTAGRKRRRTGIFRRASVMRLYACIKSCVDKRHCVCRKEGTSALGTHWCLRNVLCKACHVSIWTDGTGLLIRDGTAAGQFIASPKQNNSLLHSNENTQDSDVPSSLPSPSPYITLLHPRSTETCQCAAHSNGELSHPTCDSPQIADRAEHQACNSLKITQN
jgi:hypothetical protein